ncbi:hypothetical protein F5X68DRAFT_279872 [Plectosphaerella plurivora]|uniref:Ubiquitin carboxyl-terminal hydrolase n=1 Tax=Plectosphaerella plurivora TaxID=936078 RepID=A0A9P8V161_9PEZI|nr:hypothetical protein F5X68DRAFT_279872 [Plectosphaerella plurivora]
MQDKQLTTVSYAAGASLAAIALVYVFAPTFAHEQSAGSSSSARKKGVVGLRNYANDCFINSTLQALAGLGELRLYLIRETHRRAVDDPSVYTTLAHPDPSPESSRPPMPAWKLQSLQDGAVTRGLKDMLDALNERPIYKKATSAQDFVRVLEVAFRQRISRQQQDAQEFLQIVAERIKDEYHAGERARLHARQAGPESLLPVNGDAVQQRLERLAVTSSSPPTSTDSSSSHLDLPQTEATSAAGTGPTNPPPEEEDGFPMEGQHESQLECQTCGHRSSPRTETFVMLTLNVPHVRSTTLSSCFDEIFKTEYIDDFKCEKCRLIHAEEALKKQLARLPAGPDHDILADKIERLRAAIDTDPENPPPDVDLPDLANAPRRRIARSARITRFPKILAIHLSRSIFDTQASTKNSAKVAFPETLPLGGLADRRSYKLLGLVTHRGSHNSGHYESFRRQARGHAPYLNASPFHPSGIYSNSASPASTPRLGATPRAESPAASTPDLLANTSYSSPGSSSSTPSLDSPRPKSLRHRLSPTSAPRSNGAPETTSDAQSPLSHSVSISSLRDAAETASLRSVAASTRSAISRLSRGGTSTPPDPLAMPVPPAVRAPKPSTRGRKVPDRWWRISDEKIKETKTSDVLGMQREVYILFYELEQDGNRYRQHDP